MNTKEKIIARLNKGFGLNLPSDTNWVCRQRKYKDIGGFSWCLNCVDNIGSAEPATEVLKWKRWVIEPNTGEIFEYFDSNKERYNLDKCLIENK